MSDEPLSQMDTDLADDIGIAEEDQVMITKVL